MARGVQVVWRADQAKKPAPTPPTPGGSLQKHYPIQITHSTKWPHNKPTHRNPPIFPYLLLTLHTIPFLLLNQSYPYPCNPQPYLHIPIYKHPMPPPPVLQANLSICKTYTANIPPECLLEQKYTISISFLYFTHIYTVPAHCKNTCKNSRIPYGQSTIFSIYKNTLYPALQAIVQHSQKNRCKKRRTPFLRGPYPILLSLYYTHIFTHILHRFTPRILSFHTRFHL